VNTQPAAKASILVVSDSLYEDGDLINVPENDEQWQEPGHTALLIPTCDWDNWTRPKWPSLFTPKLVTDGEGSWHFGNSFFNVLHDTRS
jgi:hypothetical protein